MDKTASKWIVIHMVHSEESAEAAVGLLEGEGFLVKTRTVARALSSGDPCTEILVLSSEAKEARDLLSEHFL